MEADRSCAGQPAPSRTTALRESALFDRRVIAEIQRAASSSR